MAKKVESIDVGALLARLEQLEERVKELEAAASAAPLPSPVMAGSVAEGSAAPAPVPPPAEEISEEMMMVISAAVAAFLGVKAHVKQIRLISHTEAWAQHGRVSIMASHRWAMQR